MRPTPTRCTWTIVLAGLMALVLGTVPAGAQSRYSAMAGGGDSGLMLPLLLRGARLTPDQETRVKAIVEAHRATFRSVGEQLRTAQEEMASKLLGTAAVKADDLAPTVQRIAQLREQLLREAMATALEVRAVLTPEQVAKMAQTHERMKQLRAEMRALMEGK